MEVYVKESLHVLDYKDNVVDTIFLSDDHRNAGYAYDIIITEANTGYSDLKFNMPNIINDENGNTLKNPKLALLTPLVKLRYHREVYYMGEQPITVREPQGYGDTVVYIDKVYSNVYPDNVIEDYVMDYIVQPIDKKRDVLKLTTSFTAIDYPRFNLSKKRVGLNINQDTLTKKEWTLYQNKPMDVAGTIKYQQWTNNLTITAGGNTANVPLEWYPDKANEYPLNETMITNLINNTGSWPYGLLGTAFYWPIKSTGRFEGVMYTEGGFLVLQLYDFYALSKEGVDPDRHIGQYGWEWTQLKPMDSYLTPNNACNYLYHILEGTNWSVKLKEDGTPDVDIEQVSVPNPKGSTTSTTTTDHTCNINVSNSNCYNAITAVCQGLQLYPIYDCINREVSLKIFAGKNYGLTYRLGSNLTSNNVKTDGEKVITKLYVTGGKDHKGDQNINIGTAERSFINPTDNPDTRDPWNPNDPEYIIKRSPYGTNYILNFKWMYDNGWMTKEEILDLYSINQLINDWNKDFMIPYTEDRLRTLQMYNDAVNEYDLQQGKYQSILNSMMNKYYYTYGKASEGTFYAFHKAPKGLHTSNNKNYLWIGHCKACGKTWSAVSKPTTSICTCDDPVLHVEEIYIPVYNDFKDSVKIPAQMEWPYGPDIKDPAYAPHIKGDYLRLVTTLDSENNQWKISDYESRVSIVTPIPTSDRSWDGWEFKLDNVYVRSSSGHIEEWNQDIQGIESFVDAYGRMLDALDQVNYCLEKIKELDERYDAWEKQYDIYQAEIQEKYGDYIIEGNYTNNEQPYVGLLFNEGMEASEKYCVPEITYNLDVVDSSGLIEYRQPIATKYHCTQCDYWCYTPISICPKCNGDLVDTVHDTYNDLVHHLHSIGQIVPKAGDYVSIYDEPIGMFGVPGLITEISRTLDKPMNNKIKLDTAYTDDEELVGNIITATNTVLNNADIYARTAVLKADGTIDGDTISQSLDNPNANISITGTNGNMLLTGSALRFTDPNNKERAMKYTGTGIFSTTTLSESEEGTIWEKMVTPSGINAAYLNAGSIDTARVNIMSGLSAKVSMDQYGLHVRNDATKSSHLTTFNFTDAKNKAGYTKTWGTNNNLAGFIGVDPDNNALIYTRGVLIADQGSNIAGWVTDENSFYHLVDDNGTKDLWLSPSGIDGTVNNSGTKTFAIYANGNFGVTTSGILHAKDAVIQGTITSNNATITGGSLKVGDNFSVDNQGNLIAKNINAYDGKIGQFTLTQTKLYSGSGATQAGMGVYGSEYAFWAGSGTSSSAPFRVGHDGTMSSTKGDIGGWTIDSTTIKGGNTTLNSNGTITTSNLTCRGGSLSISNTGWLSIGRVSTHPIVSGLNLDVNGGLNFRTGTSVSSAGTGTGATINSASGGGLTYGSGSGNHIFSGGNLYLSATGDSSKATFSVETGTGNIETDGWIKAADSFGIRARRFNALSANGNEYHGNGDSAGQAVCFRVQTESANSLYIFFYGGICVGFGTGPGAMAGFTDISKKYDTGL